MTECSTNSARTPESVRDAVLMCFYGAHKELVKNSIDIPEKEKDGFSYDAVRKIIQDKFKQVGGDYEKPTKETLFYVILALADLAKQFRDPDVIISHFTDILNQINEL